MDRACRIVGPEQVAAWRILAYRSGTYQSYLTRQPSFLRACLAHAEENGYALGLKVVRGGYIVQERRKARIPGREGEDPVWPT